MTIDDKLKGKTSTSIVDDGITVTSAQGIGATGSPHVTPIAPAHARDRHSGEPD